MQSNWLCLGIKLQQLIGKKFSRPIYYLKQKKLKLWRLRKCIGGLQRYRKCAEKCSRAKHSFIFNTEFKILNSRDCNLFYSCARSKRVNHSGIAPLYDSGNHLYIKDCEKAELLNTYFCSIFTEDNNVLPNFEFDGLASVFDDVHLMPEIVLKHLHLSPLKYSHTVEGIPSALLRLLGRELCEPLCTIFRVSLLTGKLPSLWKTADVVPIFKKGDASRPCNYHPISLTSPICKIFERILTSQLIKHLNLNNILYSNQFGFLPEKSAVTNLLLCMNEWTSAIDNGLSVDIILISLRLLTQLCIRNC